MIGLDSCAIIDLFRGDPKIASFLQNLDEEVCVNTLVYLELMHGLNPGSKETKLEEEYYDSLFNSFLNFDLTFDSCKEAGRISAKLRKSGKTLSGFDCAIAGVYISNGVGKILTRDKEHFKSIPGIEVVSY